MDQVDNEEVRPQDARLLHLIFASAGVNEYEERVPLQLMDFAYRYTYSVLQDALVYAEHAHNSNNVTTEDIRLAVAARTNHEFRPAPPKELLMQLAQERNSRPLPVVQAGYGLRLPPEKYCLTGREWEVEEDEKKEDD
ncbi:hypothetical protein CANCADRAFT_130629 [Tortispora caseinolytica NRRL Y-17796]|uniref:Transcription initiation factor TFIID subunit 9 n=1 Tax=Tortispora caseinolytica NRRL Y-17796 TaxID=767744 RepID=A0A1E4TAU6_9ASCO|nr:hypothetical protein CANCADRAFT_130629 [Tortispora caseinolytica NRRL Y-17796]